MMSSRKRSAHFWAFAIATFLCAACASKTAAASHAVVAGNLVVSDAIAPAPVNAGAPDAQTMSVYMTIANNGAMPDTLLSVSSDVALMTMLHSNTKNGQEMTMELLPSIALPAHATVKLLPGGMHVMLEQLQHHIFADDSVSLTLSFTHHEPLHLRVHVVRYDALESIIGNDR
jgi:copper(I)-binding protein